MSSKLSRTTDLAKDVVPLLASSSADYASSSSDSLPSYASLPENTGAPRRGEARFSPAPTWSDTRCESALRPDGLLVKNTPPYCERSKDRGRATPKRERAGPCAIASPRTTDRSPLELEAGTASRYPTYRPRLKKYTLKLCALAICGFTCAAPTYSILVQSIGLWIFRPDVDPWVSLKISALILPTILGSFIVTVALFAPVLFLTLWVDAVKWSVPYGFILANIPVVVATAILPSYSIPEGFTIAHAAQLCLWGFVPLIFLVAIVGSVGLIGAGIVTCMYISFTLLQTTAAPQYGL